MEANKHDPHLCPYPSLSLSESGVGNQSDENLSLSMIQLVFNHHHVYKHPKGTVSFRGQIPQFLPRCPWWVVVHSNTLSLPPPPTLSRL